MTRELLLLLNLDQQWLCGDRKMICNTTFVRNVSLIDTPVKLSSIDVAGWANELVTLTQERQGKLLWSQVSSWYEDSVRSTCRSSYFHDNRESEKYRC